MGPEDLTGRASADHIGSSCNTLGRIIDTTNHISSMIDKSLHISDIFHGLILFSDRLYSGLSFQLTALFHHIGLDIGHKEELPQHLMC